MIKNDGVGNYGISGFTQVKTSNLKQVNTPVIGHGADCKDSPFNENRQKCICRIKMDVPTTRIEDWLYRQASH